MSSMVYDVSTMVGTIILIFFLILMTMTFGTKMTADMLNSGPLLVEDTLAAHLTVASIATGNASIFYEPKIPIPLIITLEKDTVFVEPKEEKYYPHGEIERGGVALKSPEPMEYIKLKKVDTTPEKKDFSKYNKEIIVNKIEKLSIDTK